MDGRNYINAKSALNLGVPHGGSDSKELLELCYHTNEAWASSTRSIHMYIYICSAAALQTLSIFEQALYSALNIYALALS